MGLFQNDHLFRSGLRRGNGRHQPADASAHNNDIRFKNLSCGDHHLLSFSLRVDALTCSNE